MPGARQHRARAGTCSRRSRNCSEQVASRSLRSSRTCADQSKSSSRQSCSKPAGAGAAPAARGRAGSARGEDDLQEVSVASPSRRARAMRSGRVLSSPGYGPLAGPSTTRDNDTYRASPEGLISPRGTTATHRQERITASTPPTRAGARNWRSARRCATHCSAVRRRPRLLGRTRACRRTVRGGSPSAARRATGGQRRGRLHRDRGAGRARGDPARRGRPRCSRLRLAPRAGRALSESAIARAIDRAAPRGGPGSAPASRGTRPGSAWPSTSAAPRWPPTPSSRPAAGPARRWSCATPAQRAPAAAPSRLLWGPALSAHCAPSYDGGSLLATRRLHAHLAVTGPPLRDHRL